MSIEEESKTFKISRNEVKFLDGAKIGEQQKTDVWTPVNRSEFLKEEGSGTFSKHQIDAIKGMEKPEAPNQVIEDNKTLNEQKLFE